MKNPLKETNVIRDDENQDQGCVLKQANWVHFNFMLSLNKNYIQMIHERLSFVQYKIMFDPH